MHSLCSFCMVYILSLFPGGSLLSVCVLALLALWQGVFSLLEGRCFKEGVEKLADDVFCFPFYCCLTLSFLLAIFPSLALTLLLSHLPHPYFSSISVSYGDPGWPPCRQRGCGTRMQRRTKGGACQGGVHRAEPYLHGQIASQEAPQVHRQTDNEVHRPHTYIFLNI